MRTIIGSDTGDEQHVSPGVERLNRRYRGRTILLDGIHVERISEDQSLVAELVAQQAGKDSPGESCGQVLLWLDLWQVQVGCHDPINTSLHSCLERLELERLQARKWMRDDRQITM